MILNMDETPMYFDMLQKRTIDHKGTKDVETQHNGSDKSRFTTVVTSTASGHVLPFYVILRGLKNVPKIFKTVPLPKEVVLP